MSSDKPYELGFLEEIVAVHFGGGDWFGINTVLDIQAPHNGPGTADLTFPGMSGGTPGFTLMDNVSNFGHTNFLSYSHPSNPTLYTITKDALKETHKTGGGLKITGFAVQQISGFDGFLYMFNANGFAEQFQVRTSWSGNLDTRFQTATGFWVQHGKMKAGLKFSSGQWFDLPFGAFAADIVMSSGSATFSFDKKKLTVSGS